MQTTLADLSICEFQTTGCTYVDNCIKNYQWHQNFEFHSNYACPIRCKIGYLENEVEDDNYSVWKKHAKAVEAIEL